MLRLARWLGLAALIAGADQLTKLGISNLLAPGEHLRITGFFDLVLAFNRGAAFSFLADQSGWQRLFFIAISIVAVGIIIHLLGKHAGEQLFCFGLALILGGALGNLWDRVALGHVIDFLLFHFRQYAWPAFNLADSAITIGAALLIFDSLRSTQRAKRMNRA